MTHPPHDDDDLIFADEDDEHVFVNPTAPDWKVMIVDDEHEIHEVTQLALEGFVFQEKPITFISAYSGEEAKSLLTAHPDTALIFLDVVMEEHDAGLKLARYIRETAQNKLVRIILRTGHPGEAPEETVIVDYDINDYKLKVELTHRKLFATTVTGLRGYSDLMTLEASKATLAQANVQLQENEEKYRTLFESANDAIFVLEGQQFVDCNLKALSVYGCTKEQIIGKTPDDLSPPTHSNGNDSTDSALRLFEAAFNGKPLEWRNFKCDGTPFDAEVSVNHFKLKGKDYIHAIVRDITERKRAEEERIRYIKKLGELNAKLSELNTAYQRFVPSEFLSLLNKPSVIEVQLGDQVEKEMTILFSDVRGFTSLSEKMTPQENFDFINAYLGQMEPVIGKYHGFIDKYIGDAIMALFPTSADDAVRGSIALLNTLAVYNQERQQAGLPPIKIGIGLNTGRLMLGTVGGKHRMDGTVISDAVNLASRVEGITKLYNTSLLITMQTYQQLQNSSQYQIRVIDAVRVKGKSEVVTVYEVFDADSPTSIALKSKTLSDFAQGFTLYHMAEFGEAKSFFEKVLQINENDKAAQIYLKRCEHFHQCGVPDDWEGVEALEK